MFFHLWRRRWRRVSGLRPAARFAGLQEFEIGRCTSVAETMLVSLENARVTSGPAGETRRDFREELLHDGAMVCITIVVLLRLHFGFRHGAESRDHEPASVKSILLRQCDQLLDERTHGFRFRQRRDDPLVTDEGHREIAIKRKPMRGVAIQFSSSFSMSHGSTSCQLSVVSCQNDYWQLPTYRDLHSQVQAAFRQLLLDLTQSRFAEVADFEQFFVGADHQIAHGRDAFGFEAVGRTHR